MGRTVGRQLVAGAGVAAVMAVVVAAAPLGNSLAIVGLLLVGTGVVIEARRRAAAARSG